MEKMNIVICGLGGQGILFLTKIMAQSALNKGYQVMGAETHGMAQRGGSVISHLKLGRVSSSMVRAGSAQLLLALEESEGYRYLHFLGRGGGLYANAHPASFPNQTLTPYLEEKEITCRSLPAGDIAQGLNSPKSANLVQLGFFSAFGEGPLSVQALRETVDLVSPERFKEINLKAFEAGFERAQNEG